MASDEEIELLLDSSDDDFDFLVPTILDGSSTGLEGAAGTTRGGGSGPRPGGCMLKVKKWLGVAAPAGGSHRVVRISQLDRELTG